jgi:hypothetical protein
MRHLRFALMVAAIFATAAPVYAQGYDDYNDGLQRAIRNGSVRQFQSGWARDFARKTRQAQRQYLGLQRRGKIGAARRSWRQSNRGLQRFQRQYTRGIRRVQRNRNDYGRRYNNRSNKRYGNNRRFQNNRKFNSNRRYRFNRKDGNSRRDRFNRPGMRWDIQSRNLQRKTPGNN